MSDKTFGEALDAVLATQLRSGEYIQSVYMYHDGTEPKIILNTSEQDYDYTDIIFETLDLLEEKDKTQKEVKALQDKVRALQKSEREVTKAIKLLKGGL